MIKENIVSIRERIKKASARVSLPESGQISLVAVSKGRTMGQIQEALAAGVSDIGENRVQEAKLKFEQLSAIGHQPLAIKWHLVGHLQTNKAKEAVKIFDLIHSVDSLRLAEEVDRQAACINKIQDILLEIKTSPEETKYGFAPEEAIEAVKEISALKNVSIKGLMTIAPWTDNSEKARPYFRMLKRLKDELNRLLTIDYGLSTLSMGMTDDFEVAVEEGATMVRIGRAVFEG